MSIFQKNNISGCLRQVWSVRSLTQLGLLAVVWLVLSEGLPGSWLIGLPVIVLMVILTAGGDGRERPGRYPSPAGIMAYLPFFLWQSVLSGFDVGLRAVRPDPGLQPALMSYPLNLPAGPPRRLFVNSITLMPGTLSVMVEEDTVLVHVLDDRQPIAAALERLEARVGAVFGISRKGGRSF